MKQEVEVWEAPIARLPVCHRNVPPNGNPFKCDDSTLTIYLWSLDFHLILLLLFQQTAAAAAQGKKLCAAERNSEPVRRRLNLHYLKLSARPSRKHAQTHARERAHTSAAKSQLSFPLECRSLFVGLRWSAASPSPLCSTFQPSASYLYWLRTGRITGQFVKVWHTRGPEVGDGGGGGGIRPRSPESRRKFSTSKPVR